MAAADEFSGARKKQKHKKTKLSSEEIDQHTSGIHEHVHLKKKKRKMSKREKKDPKSCINAVDYEQEIISVSGIPHSSSAEKTGLQPSSVNLNHKAHNDNVQNMFPGNKKIITSTFVRKITNRRATNQSAEAILQRRQIFVTPEKDSIIHPHNINSVNFELKHVKMLEENGIYLRVGKWTKEEDNLLCQNLQEYLNENKKYTIREVLWAEDFMEKEQIKQFLRKTEFYTQLAFRMNRMIYACYRRARLLNTDAGMKGEFSEDEITTLIRLIRLHGNKWMKIAKLMGRSPQNVIDKVKNLEGSVKGHWSETESKLLQNTVESFVKKNNQDINEENLPWSLIALHVPGRNGNQCRYHWFINVRKTVVKEGNKWSLEQEQMLINSLRAQNLENENEINWKLIQTSLGESYSIMFLKQKWYNLKHTIHVYKELSFNELLEVL